MQQFARRGCLVHLQQVAAFLRAALECSVYVAPTDPGLSTSELFEVGKRAGYQEGELGDALPRVATQYFGQARKSLPDPNPMWPTFVLPQTPDYRNVAAFDSLYSQFNDSIRASGRGARLERGVIVERAIAQGIPRNDIEAAITIAILCEVLVEKNGTLSSKHGHVMEPLPSAQPKQHGRPIHNEALERAYPIVKDVIERRTDGRVAQAEPLDAFAESLSQLGYAPFRLWWIQTVAELRRSNSESSPLSSLVLSAALVEGALTFVVKHARAKGLAVFKSRDFDGEPRRWKLEDLVRSAATGGEAAILDDKARLRALSLVETRQRIHAGRMLSEYPQGVPDLRPEEARDAKAIADLVVRCALDWLVRFPPT
jgi:hypothetical protein